MPSINHSPECQTPIQLPTLHLPLDVSWHLEQENCCSPLEPTPLPAPAFSADGTKLWHLLLRPHIQSNPSEEPTGPSFKYFFLPFAVILHNQPLSPCWDNPSPDFHFGPKQLEWSFKHKSDHVILSAASQHHSITTHKALSNQAHIIVPFSFAITFSFANYPPI